MCKTVHTYSLNLPIALASLKSWHERLGHLNSADILRLSNNTKGINLTNTSEFDCTSCILAKSKRSSYETSKNIQASSPREMIHFDFGVVNQLSFENHRYYLIFMDHATKYCWIFFLKQKSESENLIISLLQQIKTQGRITKIIRSDNALEVKTKRVSEYLQSNGILHQSRCPHAPEQSGDIERLNQTIGNSAFAMLKHSGFPKRFWNLAYYHATFIKNISPCSHDKSKTPHELWFNKVPSFFKFKTLGEQGFVHTPKHLRRKLDSKSTPCYFVGYSDIQKGYKMINLTNDKISITKDVTFLKQPRYPNFKPILSHEYSNEHGTEIEVTQLANADITSETLT